MQRFQIQLIHILLVIFIVPVLVWLYLIRDKWIQTTEAFNGAACTNGKIVKKDCATYFVPIGARKACDDGLFDMNLEHLKSQFRQTSDTKQKALINTAISGYDTRNPVPKTSDGSPICKLNFNTFEQVGREGCEAKTMSSDYPQELGDPSHWAFCHNISDRTSQDAAAKLAGETKVDFVPSSSAVAPIIEGRKKSRITMKALDFASQRGVYCKLYNGTGRSFAPAGTYLLRMNVEVPAGSTSPQPRLTGANARILKVGQGNKLEDVGNEYNPTLASRLWKNMSETKRTVGSTTQVFRILRSDNVPVFKRAVDVCNNVNIERTSANMSIIYGSNVNNMVLVPIHTYRSTDVQDLQGDTAYMIGRRATITNEKTSLEQQKAAAAQVLGTEISARDTVKRNYDTKHGAINSINHRLFIEIGQETVTKMRASMIQHDYYAKPGVLVDNPNIGYTLKGNFEVLTDQAVGSFIRFKETMNSPPVNPSSLPNLQPSPSADGRLTATVNLLPANTTSMVVEFLYFTQADPKVNSQFNTSYGTFMKIGNGVCCVALLNTRKMRVYSNAGNSVLSKSAVPANTWVRVRLEWTAINANGTSEMALYINDVLQNKGPFRFSGPANGLSIGFLDPPESSTVCGEIDTDMYLERYASEDQTRWIRPIPNPRNPRDNNPRAGIMAHLNYWRNSNESGKRPHEVAISTFSRFLTPVSISPQVCLRYERQGYRPMPFGIAEVFVRTARLPTRVPGQQNPGDLFYYSGGRVAQDRDLVNLWTQSQQNQGLLTRVQVPIRCPNNRPESYPDVNQVWHDLGREKAREDDWVFERKITRGTVAFNNGDGVIPKPACNYIFYSGYLVSNSTTVMKPGQTVTLRLVTNIPNNVLLYVDGRARKGNDEITVTIKQAHIIQIVVAPTNVIPNIRLMWRTEGKPYAMVPSTMFRPSEAAGSAQNIQEWRTMRDSLRTLRRSHRLYTEAISAIEAFNDPTNGFNARNTRISRKQTEINNLQTNINSLNGRIQVINAKLADMEKIFMDHFIRSIETNVLTVSAQDLTNVLPHLSYDRGTSYVLAQIG